MSGRRSEAALQVEAVHGLGHGEVLQTANLLGAWRPHVVSGAVRQVLRLVEAALRARAGQYTQAAAVAQSVAAGEPEAEARQGLEALAAHYGARAAEAGAAGRGADPEGVSLFGEPADVLGTAVRAEAAAEAHLSVYPNPVARQATVTLALAEASAAVVTVFDVLGREVAVLHRGALSVGAHRFALDASALPSGVYLVRGTVGAARFTERLTVVR